MSELRLLKARLAKIANKYVIVNESGDGVAQAMIMADDIHKYTAEIIKEVSIYITRHRFDLTDSAQIEDLDEALQIISKFGGSTPPIHDWTVKLDLLKKEHARKMVSQISGRRALDKSEGPKATDIDKLGDTPFQGKRVVFHGFYQYYRTSNSKSVIKRGGKVDPRVTKKTDFLITNNRLTGQPYRLAVKYGIPIIGSAQFDAILKKTKPIIF